MPHCIRLLHNLLNVLVQIANKMGFKKMPSVSWMQIQWKISEGNGWRNKEDTWVKSSICYTDVKEAEKLIINLNTSSTLSRIDNYSVQNFSVQSLLHHDSNIFVHVILLGKKTRIWHVYDHEHKNSASIFRFIYLENGEGIIVYETSWISTILHGVTPQTKVNFDRVLV
jgi:hypothetical protein